MVFVHSLSQHLPAALSAPLYVPEHLIVYLYNFSEGIVTSFLTWLSCLPAHKLAEVKDYAHSHCISVTRPGTREQKTLDKATLSFLRYIGYCQLQYPCTEVLCDSLDTY